MSCVAVSGIPDPTSGHAGHADSWPGHADSHQGHGNPWPGHALFSIFLSLGGLTYGFVCVSINANVFSLFHGERLGREDAVKGKSEFWADGRVLVNVQHENFALYIAEGLSKAEAWRRAYNRPQDYKVRSGQPSALLRKHPEIAYRIAQIRKDIAARAVQHAAVSHAYVLDRLKENVERCMQKEAVRNKKGQETGEWKYNAGPAIKALELLGRSVGLFAEKGKATDLENADEHELKAELDRLRREVDGEVGEGSGDPEGTEPEEALSVSPIPEAS